MLKKLGINFRIVIAILAVVLFVGIFTYDVIIPSLKVDLSPQDADYYYNLGYNFLELGKNNEAINAFNQAIKINPDFTDAHFYLGEAYWNLYMYREAIGSFERASAKGDGYATNNLAWILSTCPDDDIRDGKRAISIMKQLIDREGRDSLRIDTLAAAYAEVGNFPEAIKLMHEAIFRSCIRSWFLLGPIRILLVVPRFGTRAAELMETPIMFVIIIVAAWWIVRHLAVPFKPSYRFGIGCIALGLLLVAEFTLVLWLQGLSIKEYLANRDPVSGDAAG